MEAYCAGRLDDTAQKRIWDELDDPNSFASKYVKKLCEEARTLYDDLDWKKLPIDIDE